MFSGHVSEHRGGWIGPRRGEMGIRIDAVELDGVDGPRFRLHSAERSGDRSQEKPFMNEVKAVGLDLAKRVFQGSGVKTC